MMINKRLIGAVPESKKYIAGNVALQWCSLCANIAMMSAVTALLAALYAGSMTQSKIVTTAARWRKASRLAPRMRSTS